MDEPKRRGRPPKVSAAVEAQKDTLSVVTVIDDMRHGIQAIGVDELDAMNALALRIWESQSPDLSNRERVARVKSRLVKMGFTDLGALSLPCDEKYLNA